MAVPFTSIPGTTLAPFFYAELDASAAGIGGEPKRALLVGQRMTAGTIAAGVLTQVFGAAQARTYFGRGSQLHRMIEAYRANDPTGELWAVALDDGAAVAAVRTITVTGPATAAGTIHLYVGGVRLQIAVANTDSATTIATAIRDAIGTTVGAADLPITAASAAGVVTITNKNGGEAGNDTDVRVNYRGAAGGEVLPAGVGVGVAQTVTGATNPSIVPARTAIAGQRFDFVGHSYTDTTQLDAWQTEHNHTAGRWSPSVLLFGHVYTARRGTVGGLTTFGAARNDAHQTVFGYDAFASTIEAVVGAMLGEVAAARRNHVSRPLQTLSLVGVLGPVEGVEFTLAERETLLGAGVSTLSVSRREVSIHKAVTTYQRDTSGADDTAYLHETTPHQIAETISTMRTALQRQFPRHVLVADASLVSAGEPVVSVRTLRAFVTGVYQDLVSRAVCQDPPTFLRHLVVQQNPTNPNRVDFLLPPVVANQLEVLAMLVQFRTAPVAVV